MTSTRLARGTKGRVLLYLCAVILVTGIIALYRSTQSQLEDVRKSSELCHQQQESLSTQLQVIFEYKQRLEKSLQAEQAEHKQTKNELEGKINNEKSRRNKTSMEASLRFTSLQQHYKILQSQHEDYKEEAEKKQQQLLTEISNLQAKFKELQGQLKKQVGEKDNALELLKTQYSQAVRSRDEFERKLKNTDDDTVNSENEIHKLRQDNAQLRKQCHLPLQKLEGGSASPPSVRATTAKVSSSTSFAKQVAIGDSVYQIRDSKDRPLEKPSQSQDNQLNNPNDVPENNEAPQQIFKNNENSNVLAMPPNAENAADNVQHAHIDLNHGHVLAAPNMDKPKVATPKTTTKAGFKVSKPSLDGAKPLLQPAITTPPTKPKTSSSSPKSNANERNMKNVLLPPNYAQQQQQKKRLPEGVVAAPPEMPAGFEETKPEEKNIPDEINDALPNRYRNNIIDSEMQHANKAAPPPETGQNPLEFNMGLDMNQENSAAEVLDAAGKIQEDPFNVMDANNLLDLENRHALKNVPIPLVHHGKFKKQHIDDLRMGEAKLNGGELGNGGGAGYNDEPDYDKDAQRGEDLQLEEAEGGEDDDPDDYEGHLGERRQKEPAVRN